MIIKPRLFRKPRKGIAHGIPMPIYLGLYNENGGSIVQDLSGNGKVGTLAGNASWDAGFVVCENNGDKISMATPAFIGTGTIIFSFNGSGTPNISGKLCVTTDAEFQLYRVNVDTTLNLYINGSTAPFEGLPDIWDNVEYIIAVTWDAIANERKIYINGILKGTSGAAFTWDAANLGATFYIGDRGDGTRNAGGRFGWFSGYNRVLTASQIAQLFIDPFPWFKKDPIELWSAAMVAGEPPVGIPILRRRRECA